jgi:hypothetical protein
MNGTRWRTFLNWRSLWKGYSVYRVSAMSYKAGLLSASLFALGIFGLLGQQTTPPSIFTAAQAEAGRAAFENTCAKCHTASLMGRKGDPGELPPVSSLSDSYQKFIGPRGFVSPLAGKTFLSRFGSKTAAELIARFQETVPAFPPEGMDDQTTVNITAYVLQMNGATAGNVPLTRSTGVVVSSVTR